MTELQQYIQSMLKANPQKIIISNPFSKSEEYKKIIIEDKGKTYQIAKYTEKRVAALEDGVAALALASGAAAITYTLQALGQNG